ncbi:MAG: NAD(P)-binding domain-containing protein [Candidatus Altiarchaeota archaeon]|nr:NAD(P)-binding domain-containing protein [Candidatus Altiarchaeota archaeon]
MKPKILMADNIHRKAIEEAEKFADVTIGAGLSAEDLTRMIPEFDALVVRSATQVTREVMDAGKKLRIVGRAGVGLDNIDVEAAKEKGIKVVNSPEASTVAVTELVFGSLIALNRRIVHAHHSMKEGMWERSRFEGNELCGKTIGIIGFGRIGREVAMRARAFGMNVLAYDPNITREDCKEYSSGYCTDLDDLIKRSDVITVHVPLVEKTRNLIDERRLNLMKKDAVAVNISRGGIINEEALYKTLKDGRIRGAVLDVYECEPPKKCPFTTLDNVIHTPHLGASTEEAQINAGTVVVEKIRNFFTE